MNSFYTITTQTLIDTDGFIIEFIGDAVAGIYPPGFCGPEHARKAIVAADRLVRGPMPCYPDGSELGIGIGVHTGTVFIGTVAGAEGRYHDVQPLGDNVNVTARLSNMAAPGEALISDAVFAASRCGDLGLETRQLELRGRTAPIAVHVIRRDSPGLRP